jgi:hypothetical protein
MKNVELNYAHVSIKWEKYKPQNSNKPLPNISFAEDSFDLMTEIFI